MKSTNLGFENIYLDILMLRNREIYIYMKKKKGFENNNHNKNFASCHEENSTTCFVWKQPLVI